MQWQNLVRASVASALACGALAVHGQSLDKTFATFTACDAGFFKSIASDQATWRAVAPIEGNDTAAWIATKNRKAADGNVLELPGKPTVAGLPVTHYLDESSSLSLTSHFYYWGFKISGTVDSVKEKIAPLVYDNKRLRKDDDVYVRTELRTSNKPWAPARTVGGVPPRMLTMERALLIENDADLPNTVKVLCSLQGDLTAEVLGELRPDISPKEYPESIDPELFSKTPANEEILKIVKLAAEGSTQWAPKFKRVTYSQKSGNDETPVTVVNTNDGLLDVTEDYGIFKMRRQMLAGLVQTKSRFNTTGSIYVTKQLDLKLPGDLAKGSVLEYLQTSQNVPTQPGDKASSFGLKCVVGDAFEASKIFSTLTGRAVALQCTDPKGTAQGRAFLEDLGLFVDYTPASGFFGSAKPKYTRFSVEQ